MKAYFQDFLRYALTIMKKIWTTKRGGLALLAAVAVVYTGVSMVIGEARNPLWMLWWAISGSFAFSVSAAAYQIYVNRLEKQLNEAISNPPGFKYLVSTSDGANIGEVEEIAYLKAKFEADTCFVTKALQAVNFVWVAWSILVKALVFMPVLLVAAALAYRFFVSDGSLSEITLGQVIESNLLIMSFQFTLILMIVISFIGGMRAAPGYKNHYELRLRKLLSKELPNIANAHGFSVTGYKINLTEHTTTVV